MYVQFVRQVDRCYAISAMHVWINIAQPFLQINHKQTHKYIDNVCIYCLSNTDKHWHLKHPGTELLHEIIPLQSEMRAHTYFLDWAACIEEHLLGKGSLWHSHIIGDPPTAFPQRLLLLPKLFHKFNIYIHTKSLHLHARTHTQWI